MPAINPVISVLKGFAQSRDRFIRATEREIHRGDELPVGDGWQRIEYDPAIKFAVWERTRPVKVPA